MSELTKLENFLGLPMIPIHASKHGVVADGVNEFIHWIMFILFIGWFAFFVYSLIRFRKSSNPKANYYGVTSHHSRYVEGAIIIVEIILLFGFSIPLYSKWTNDFPAEKDSVVVRVVAEQFAWNFHYAGADGIFGKGDPSRIDVQSNPLGLDRTGDPYAKDDVVTSTLHVAKGKPTITHISSKDVIHSFGVPALRLKQDAIPGITIPIHFVPTREGKYLIACSQLCGVGHAKMKGVINVHSQTDFDAWLAKAGQEAAASAADGDVW